MPISHVLFDWGGVLIHSPAPALMKYCANALRVEVGEYTSAHRLFEAGFQKGLIDESVFWKCVCSTLRVDIPQRDSLWQDALYASFTKRPKIFEFIRVLRERGLCVGVLSNTELPAIRYFREHYGKIFDISIFSCIEQVRKPEFEIYHRAAQYCNVSPQNILFIDDVDVYVRVAEQCGFHGIHFSESKTENTVIREINNMIATSYREAKLPD